MFATIEHIETEIPPTPISSALTVDDSALSQSEIQGVLSEISNFAYAYIECKEVTKEIQWYKEIEKLKR